MISVDEVHRDYLFYIKLGRRWLFGHRRASRIERLSLDFETISSYGYIYFVYRAFYVPCLERIIVCSRISEFLFFFGFVSAIYMVLVYLVEDYPYYN